MAEATPTARVVRFGTFEADLRAGELRKNGLKIKLQEQPFQILAMLLERPGEVVTREELQKRLWSGDTFVDFDHSLSASVNKLRDALGDSADNPRFVETLPRRGYRFVYPVEGLKVSSPSQEVAVEASATPKRRARQVHFWIAGFALLGMVAVLAGLNVGGWWDRFLGGPASGEIRSLAVLPLENLSDDPEQEYFVDGMTEALIADLGKIGALRVISRRSVMRYKGSNKPLPEIAGELNVDAIVEGSVLRAGDQVRITAQLVNAFLEQYLWADSYQRDLRDVLSLQSEVARAIAEEIKVAVTPQEQTRLASARPVNPEAHEFYLKGRYHLNKWTKEGWEKAIEYFQNQAKLLDAEIAKQEREQAQSRKSQVGSGDRSERIRTYNYPQGRVTDHRINLTLYKLAEILEGDLDQVVDPLVSEYQADQLAALGA